MKQNKVPKVEYHKGEPSDKKPSPYRYDRIVDETVVNDSMGYWNPDNFGKIVQFSAPDGRVSMNNVNFPVMAISNKGEYNMQMPGQEYQYKGDFITEYPMAKNGGWLDSLPMAKNGGGLLNKTLTCPKCGWSWKAVDGGTDITTCHKCGGTAKLAYGGLHKAQKGEQVEDNDSWLENIAEIVDPTGISSWDDIYRAYKNSGVSKELALESLGAIPFLGKVSKVTKPGIHLTKYSGIDQILKNTLPRNKSLSRSANVASKTGRGTDAVQAVLGAKDNSGFTWDMRHGEVPKYNGRNIFPQIDLGEHGDFAYGGDASLPNIEGHYQDGGAQTPEEWEKQIRAVENKIGDPSTWTLDSYKTLQDKLNEYKAWRENTEKGKAVVDYHNEPNEYVVPLPDHLKDPNMNYEKDLISKVLMNRNRDKDFVKRAYDVGAYPDSNMFTGLDTEDFGNRMSHKMSWGEDDSGQAYMYPNIYNTNNEAIKVPNQYADYISSEGYKKATGMIPERPFGGQNTKTHTHMKEGGWLDQYQDAGQLRAATSYQGAHQNPVAYEQKVNAKVKQIDDKLKTSDKAFVVYDGTLYNNPYADPERNEFLMLDKSGSYVPSGVTPFDLIDVAQLYSAAKAASAANKGTKALSSKAGKYLTTKTPLKNTYKINPFALKENPEMYLYRARPVGQNPNMNMAAQLRAKEAAGKPLTWFQKNLLNPQTNPQMLAREKYYGQWFEKDPSRLDWYIDPGRRNFADDDIIEILRTRLPKSEAAKLNVSQFDDAKILSSSPETEFILPKDMVNTAETFPIGSWQELIQQDKAFNTPHWLRGYKKLGGWLDAYDDEYRRGGQRRKRGTSKNIKSSINDLFRRNYDVYGPAGKNRYDPTAYKTGGWLDNID